MKFKGGDLLQAWGRFFSLLPWSLSLTFTFAPWRKQRLSKDAASREIFRWLGELGRAVRRPLVWIYGMERHADGQWHGHVLLCDVTEAEVQASSAMWQQRNGTVHTRLIRYGPGAVIYSSKENATSGELVFSDALTHYRGHLLTERTCDLFPDDRQGPAVATPDMGLAKTSEPNSLP